MTLVDGRNGEADNLLSLYNLSEWGIIISDPAGEGHVVGPNRGIVDCRTQHQTERSPSQVRRLPKGASHNRVAFSSIAFFSLALGKLTFEIGYAMLEIG